MLCAPSTSVKSNTIKKTSRSAILGSVTVNRYPRYQITSDMVPHGVAFPHYEIFRCRYKITSEIVPGRSPVIAKVLLADIIQSRLRGRVEASGSYSGTELCTESVFGRVSM